MQPPGNIVPPANPNPPAGTPAANSVVNAAPAAGSNAVGVFVAPQTLVTFPIATSAVTTITAVLSSQWGLDREVVSVVVSLLIGVVIYIGTVSQGAGFKQKVMEGAVAIINSFTIAAAALGLGNVTNPTPTAPVATPTPTPLPTPLPTGTVGALIGQIGTYFG